MRALAAALLLFAASFGTSPAVAAEAVTVPGYWDLRRRQDKPNTSRIRVVRFMTESDYPPFHFTGPDGALTGFEVDLARALCDLLDLACTVQARRFDTLAASLERGDGDAVIAAWRITGEARRRFLFTSAYHRSPARFVVAKSSAPFAPTPAGLRGKRIATVAGSAHEAFLHVSFPGAAVVTERDTAAVLDAVRYGGADAGFVDGVAASFWLNGEVSAGCCAFAGGPYTESRFFGEGTGIAVRRDNPALQAALDWGLQKLAADGTYTALYLKYFPVSFY